MDITIYLQGTGPWTQTTLNKLNLVPAPDMLLETPMGKLRILSALRFRDENDRVTGHVLLETSHARQGRAT